MCFFHMAPHSDRNKKWREQNKEVISHWKKKFDELLDRRSHEWWDEDKFEMEIGNALQDQDLRDIWFFVTSYVSRYPRSNLSQFFSKAIEEIKTFGTIEPYKKRHLVKSIETTRRKMSGKK